MKKKLIVFSLFFMGIFTMFLINTNALGNSSKEKLQSNSSKKIPGFTASSKEKNQMFGYFMLDLYHTEIMDAFNEHYKDTDINGYMTPKPPHYDIVSISQFERKDLEKYSYVLKITLLPMSSKGKTLGKDTLYFSVEPSRQTMKNLSKEYPPIELIKYEHSKVPKKNK